MDKLKVGVALFVVIALGGLAYAVEILARHASDTSWPQHARYHLVVSALHVIAISFMIAFTALTALRRGSRQAWGMLVALSLLVWLGWPVARLATGEPTSWAMILLLAAALALVAAAQSLSKPQKT